MPITRPGSLNWLCSDHRDKLTVVDTASLTNSIKAKALEVGFDLVGISPVGPFPENQFYKEWLARGFAGEMKYMGREPEKRENILNVLPEARSVISCGLNYNTDYPYSTRQDDKRRGWISRYAWGDDYHEVLKSKLSLVLDFIEEVVPQEVKSRLYVDTGPVLDRVYGKYSGIGWYGKNTCLINQEIGSWIFIGEIITNLELDYDSPALDRCGTCTRCIDACPTGALLEPYVLDSRLCISYLTIEQRGGIPIELREKVGNNIYGCDICQDVCPWNRKAEVANDPSFQPRDGLYNPDLSTFSNLSEEKFRWIFKGSAIKRAKRSGFLRNVTVAMGNSGDKDFIPYVKEYLKNDDPLVRAHAAWALWRLDGEGSYRALSDQLDAETDPIVREEIVAILGGYGDTEARIQNSEVSKASSDF
ncbi:MAG TPA: tRNA epoxyqueuosine(34) reductase QueG [Thermodesulfobacteriota bacterium]|nr:tRNA epoxyqueuosine(34) reductase QueG [Thermodesulfobacteriota bacterium]